MSELQRVLDCLAALPPTSRRGRRARSDDLDRALAELISERYCPACHARGEIERSQLSLVLASLALPPVRDRYVASNGLCARHAIKTGEGQAARVAKVHADARLGVLGWELEETARKYAWACRHESAGPEQDAWLRAAAQIDGRVFEGCPAPAQAR